MAFQAMNHGLETPATSPPKTEATGNSEEVPDGWDARSRDQPWRDCGKKCRAKRASLTCYGVTPGDTVPS